MTVDIDRLIEWLIDNFDEHPCNYNNYDEVLFDALGEKGLNEICNSNGGKKCWIELLKALEIMEGGGEE